MQIAIPYGLTTLTAQSLRDTALLAPEEPLCCLSPAGFAEEIRRQLSLRPLDLSEVMIVVADKTRLCGYDQYLPILVQVLQEFGLNESRLRFIIAYGTHPRQSDDECRQCYGETYSRSTFIHHDCSKPELFTELGTTARGVPIRVRTDLFTASSVITMGPLCHHYFAGYGGGRKLIFPGCGEREAIYANHGLYLDRSAGRLHPACQPGRLEGNPLAEDLFEIGTARPADLAIHGILDSRGRLCDIFSGSSKDDYLRACACHARLYESDAPAFNNVIASCGGYPKDINFIQSHKAIHNGSMFVADGGTLLLFAQCRDGIGSKTFLPWFDLGGFAAAFERLSRGYAGNGGTALAMMAKTDRIRIAMVTELDEAICATIGVEKWSRAKALDYIQNLQEPACYIANAGLLVRKPFSEQDETHTFKKN